MVVDHLPSTSKASLVKRGLSCSLWVISLKSSRAVSTVVDQLYTLTNCKEGQLVHGQRAPCEYRFVQTGWYLAWKAWGDKRDHWFLIIEASIYALKPTCLGNRRFGNRTLKSGFWWVCCSLLLPPRKQARQWQCLGIRVSMRLLRPAHPSLITLQRIVGVRNHWSNISLESWSCGVCHGGYLVDPASSHMLVSKIKPCMSKYK